MSVISSECYYYNHIFLSLSLFFVCGYGSHILVFQVSKYRLEFILY